MYELFPLVLGSSGARYEEQTQSRSNLKLLVQIYSTPRPAGPIPSLSEVAGCQCVVITITWSIYLEIEVIFKLCSCPPLASLITVYASVGANTCAAREAMRTHVHVLRLRRRVNGRFAKTKGHRRCLVHSRDTSTVGATEMGSWPQSPCPPQPTLIYPLF